MTPLILTLALAALGAAAILVVALKLKVWPRRIELLAAVRTGLASPSARWWGLGAAFAYLVVFFVWGGRGGRIHYFYGEWIFSFGPADVVVGLLTAVLMGLVVALLLQTIRQVGMFKTRESGVGLAGTLLAVAASFCP